ncbi:alpha/beta-hydrolase [Wilcoxina mikolae CBS 423.85]|nr:alpha/beta-hydrolase [Wilcoxina mikolae CBS 423.85]
MAKSILNISTIKSTEFYSNLHSLQSLDVYQVSKAPGALWIIFLHGGAWRDPRVTSSVGTTLLNHLINTKPSIMVNTASINYRLSPHPEYPQLIDNVAKHPDHLNDVLEALRHLREKYLMREYILIGHSAGATLAFQALGEIQKIGGELPQPKAIYGLEGIYDLTAMVDEYPDYQGFVEGAFGPKDKWPEPLGLQNYKGLVVLAHSDQDELLSWRQTEEMKQRCENTLGVGGGVRVVKVAGTHDKVLEYERLGVMVDRYLRELLD